MSTINARDLIHGPTDKPDPGRFAIGLFDSGLSFVSDHPHSTLIAANAEFWLYESDMALIIREMKPHELAPHIRQGLPSDQDCERGALLVSPWPDQCTFYTKFPSDPPETVYWILEADLIRGLKAIYAPPTQKGPAINARDLIHEPTYELDPGRIAIGLFEVHGLLFFAEPVIAGRRSVASTTLLWVYEADMAKLIREVQPPELAPFIYQGLPPADGSPVMVAHGPAHCTFTRHLSISYNLETIYWIPEADLIQGLKAIYDRPLPGNESLSPLLTQPQLVEPSSRGRIVNIANIAGKEGRSINVGTVKCIKIECVELGSHLYKVHFQSLNTNDPSTFSTDDLSDLNTFEVGAWYKVSITAVN